MAVPQSDQPSLCFPEELPRNMNLTHDSAATMLVRAATLANQSQVAFTYKYIDQPLDGSMWVVFMQPNIPPPQDGVRYLETEQRYTTAVNPQLEVEIAEQRFGFVPGKEQVASRVRRRYRVVRGGHPAFVMYHYGRGPVQPVPAQLAMAPIRAYPLRHPPTDIGLYVLGPKTGQRVQLPAGRPVEPPQADPRQAALASQNRELERQRHVHNQAQQRAPPANAPPPPARLEEETDAADDLEHISTRTLAATRYKRNHEIMSEVFVRAGFKIKDEEKPSGGYKSQFNKAELEEKISKLTEDLQDLRSASARKQAEAEERSNIEASRDVSMVGV